MRRRAIIFLTMLVMVALLPFQIRCSSSSSNAEQATTAEAPSLVQISHTIPPQVTLLDLPFIAEFILEMPSGGNGDIAYYAVQSSAPNITYLPNGITYKEVPVDPNLKENGNVTLLIVAANNAGAITRLEVDVILNTDCPGCDLSCKDVDDRGYYRCATYWGIDFTSANLTGASFRGQALSEVNFSNADLTYADMSSDLPEVYTVLHRCNFTGADLLGADLTGYEISGAEWAGARCPDGTYADDNGGTCIGHL